MIYFLYFMQSEGAWPPPRDVPCGVVCKTLQHEKNTRQHLDVRRYVGLPDLDAAAVWAATRGTTYDYRPCDWLRVGLDHVFGRCGLCAPPPTRERMFCSAFAAFFFNETGVVHDDWSDVVPQDLAVMESRAFGPVERLK